MKPVYLDTVHLQGGEENDVSFGHHFALVRVHLQGVATPLHFEGMCVRAKQALQCLPRASKATRKLRQEARNKMRGA